VLVVVQRFAFYVRIVVFKGIVLNNPDVDKYERIRSIFTIDFTDQADSLFDPIFPYSLKTPIFKKNRVISEICGIFYKMFILSV